MLCFINSRKYNSCGSVQLIKFFWILDLLNKYHKGAPETQLTKLHVRFSFLVFIVMSQLEKGLRWSFARKYVIQTFRWPYAVIINYKTKVVNSTHCNMSYHLFGFYSTTTVEIQKRASVVTKVSVCSKSFYVYSKVWTILWALIIY